MPALKRKFQPHDLLKRRLQRLLAISAAFIGQHRIAIVVGVVFAAVFAPPAAILYERWRPKEGPSVTKIEQALGAVAAVGVDTLDHQRKKENLLGSGVFIDSGGILVTNNSILGEEDLQHIWAKLFTKPDSFRVFRLEQKICADAGYDIAILKFKATQPPPHIRLGDSDRIEGFQEAFIASAGLQHAAVSVKGIISNPPLTPVAPGISAVFIQLQRHPSGEGALLDKNGDLLGILAKSPGIPVESAGLNYAVPARILRPFLPSSPRPGDSSSPAEASQDPLRNPNLCDSLHPDYLRNLQAEIISEARAIAAARRGQYEDAVGHYEDAIRYLHLIVSAKTMAPPRDLRERVKEVEAQARDEAKKHMYAEAVKHYQEDVDDLKMIAFAGAAETSP